MNIKNIINFAEIKTIIYCENFNHEVIGAYMSVKDAAEDFLIDESEIFDAIESKKQLLGSGFWYRGKGFLLDSKLAKFKKAKLNPGRITERGKHSHPDTSIAVVQLDYETLVFINRYDSMYEAFRSTGARNISKCCKGEAQSSGGYRWMFESEYIAMTDDNLDDLM